uniref:RRM domain-containing protein n=1 Tax=Kalanchoe fedtschenkoi TaxID=63787 RepID=A0A7N0UKW0_KALFE
MLPLPQVIGPDEDGTWTALRYAFDHDGHKFVHTTTTRVRKLPKASLSDFETWADSGKYYSTNKMLLESRRASGTKSEEKESYWDLLAKMRNGDVLPELCQNCGKTCDHWTSECPYTDLAAPVETFVDKRVYAAIVDQKTGATIGLGFINFANKEAAEIAINKLNGFRDDNLMLRVDWATPRAN